MTHHVHMRILTAEDVKDGMKCEGCPRVFAAGDPVYAVEEKDDIRDCWHCQACHDRAWRQKVIK